ncbi:DUF1080 domain-containing protein [Robiginitalea sp. SC105]|uniref:3-keto-disaccharide hydrolase n=1 Tax=Robiginitalea sp. SC105 TaxID=2762332 RepID=UPI00163B5455|nr:DUF1080 domain-containing protein [Robiginitalea sp. SC105]MBC2840073.1 DUF1080 domain-containing protein [Robiginitalea sp. SC105]
MRASLLFLLILALAVACGEKKGPQTGEPDLEEPEWIQLFNGKDLGDWQPKIRGFELGDNYRGTFRVEDSILKVSYADYDTIGETYGHLFYKTPFSRYRLRAEYRFVGEQVADGPEWAYRNNGFMLHCQSPASMGLHQDFPISLEAQLLGGRDEGERSTMNLCTPGSNVVMDGELRTEHCMNSNSKTFRGDRWVTVEMVVLGDSVIHHLVEGDTVMTYFSPRMGGGAISGYKPEAYVEGQPMASGYIAIQAESHPTEFRKIELQLLEQ